MSSGLKRHQQTGDLHFITFSCVRHRPILGTPQARDKFLEILEKTRQRHLFDIHGYAVMPASVRNPETIAAKNGNLERARPCRIFVDVRFATGLALTHEGERSIRRGTLR